MRLIITRHGETIENQQGIIQGQLPGRLSETGKKQAKLVAQRLKNEKIDFIYSSDLARATDTAKEISRFHKEMPIEFVKELRERNLGEFQGKKRKDFTTPLPQPKKGENREQLYDRAKGFLEKVLKKHKNDTVLFVTHGGLARCIIANIQNIPLEDVTKLSIISNTSITIYEIDEDKKHKVHTYNCVKHLD